MKENKTFQLGIAKEIQDIFTNHGETRQKRSNIFNLSQDEIQLLFGMATDIRVILYDGVVTIHPMLLEGSHDNAWAVITSRYLKRIIMSDKMKEGVME